jgi:F0F1-type ATP synthase membrane subunit c/vacuolar-type H+-ATPase subunit K
MGAAPPKTNRVSARGCEGGATQSVGGAGLGNLIFGFAITEALGIFSLLIALLLLFGL